MLLSSLRISGPALVLRRASQRNRGVITLVILVTLFLTLAAYIAHTLEIHQKWGMSIIVTLQKHRTWWLDIIFHIFSAMGFEAFFVVIPLLILSGRKRVQIIGLNLCSQLNFALLVISVLKTIFVEPRPLWLDESIQKANVGAGQDYSFPSGHAFASTVCWTYLTYCFQHQKWLPLACSLVIASTCSSRVYFGVHYPHDVITGIVLGLIAFIFQDFFSICEQHGPRHDDKEVEASGEEGLDMFTLPRVGSMRSRHLFQLAFLAVFLPFSFTLLSREQMRRQMGMFYSLGCIVSSIFTYQIVSLSDSNTGGFKAVWRFGLRTVIGIVPSILVFALAIHFDVANSPQVEAIMFCLGFIFQTIVYTLSPLLCIWVGLGSSSGYIVTRKSKSQ
ncbi:phosphoesterase PA-phosphatase-like protein [Planoprotostelium fungivorum]|uniref:Phosphoesterase PA-phosphatase-like protein n=1 Tax=Planoprotostelium fungivorum TaxID=1890364 RepID=A0A2P6MRI4_9EUKA|nr:phosphoesterase PA-phosphatase-like protein [Planoprotostelium fungivorum]